MKLNEMKWGAIYRAGIGGILIKALGRGEKAGHCTARVHGSRAFEVPVRNLRRVTAAAAQKYLA